MTNPRGSWWSNDNPATLYSTARILRSANFEVIEATTGQDALDLASTGIDLLMLDVNLPDIHGFEVCQRLRRIRARPVSRSSTFPRLLLKKLTAPRDSTRALTVTSRIPWNPPC